MRKRLAQLVVFTLLVCSYFSLVPTPIQAQTKEWSGFCVDCKNPDVATIQGLECMLANIFTVFISLIGLAAFVMFIVGSFRWMLSGGESKGVSKAKGSMTYAIVGIVVSLSAYIVLNVIASFTGVTVITAFQIPTSEIALEDCVAP